MDHCITGIPENFVRRSITSRATILFTNLSRYSEKECDSTEESSKSQQALLSACPAPKANSAIPTSNASGCQYNYIPPVIKRLMPGVPSRLVLRQLAASDPATRVAANSAKKK
jgi:hypothetical protein